MATRPLDLEGVPEPQARQLHEQAEFWRRRTTLKNARAGHAKRIEFTETLGTVYGRLTREEMYDGEQ